MRKNKVLIVGDLFLDHYLYYEPNRGSPSLETGIKPIVAIKESFAPGAAGNVAKNFSHLGANVRIVSIIGKDGNALELTKTLKNQGIDISFLIYSAERITPVYTKFININTQREDLPRVDLLPSEPVSKKANSELIDKLNQNLQWADAIVIVDQMENPKLGVITEEVKELLDKAKTKTPKHFFVDSRVRPYAFKGYIVKPNLREFKEIVSYLHMLDEENLPLQIIAQRYAVKVSQALESNLIVTASEDGAYVVEKGKLFRIFSIPTDVVDVTGGGDAFMAATVMAEFLLKSNNKNTHFVEAASIGIKAATLCVSQQGTGDFTLKDVLKLPNPEIEKVISKDIFVNHPKEIKKIKFALFDFDGTLSLLREGWQSIMKEVMIESITGGKKIPKEEMLKIEKEVEEYINRTTGQQTILQMIGLKQMVKKYGLIPKEKIKEPLEYKNIYNQRLKKIVRKRVKENKKSKYLLKGSYEFLMDLKKAGLKLLAASGTDLKDVLEEADFLGIKSFFDVGIYGAIGADYKKHTKEAVIKRLLKENNLKGEELVIFGDGPVEILVGKKVEALTIGVASNERKGWGWNLRKFQRLKNVGADILIPDFTIREKLEKKILSKKS